MPLFTQIFNMSIFLVRKGRAGQLHVGTIFSSLKAWKREMMRERDTSTDDSIVFKTQVHQDIDESFNITRLKYV